MIVALHQLSHIIPMHGHLRSSYRPPSLHPPGPPPPPRTPPEGGTSIYVLFYDDDIPLPHYVKGKKKIGLEFPPPPPPPATFFWTGGALFQELAAQYRGILPPLTKHPGAAPDIGIQILSAFILLISSTSEKIIMNGLTVSKRRRVL